MASANTLKLDKAKISLLGKEFTLSLPYVLIQPLLKVQSTVFQKKDLCPVMKQT